MPTNRAGTSQSAMARSTAEGSMIDIIRSYSAAISFRQETPPRGGACGHSTLGWLCAVPAGEPNSSGCVTQVDETVSGRAAAGDFCAVPGCGGGTQLAGCRPAPAGL